MWRQVGTIVRCRVLGAVCLIDEGQEPSGRGWRMHRMQDGCRMMKVHRPTWVKKMTKSYKIQVFRPVCGAHSAFWLCWIALWVGFDVCTATSQARQTGKCWWSMSIRLALGILAKGRHSRPPRHGVTMSTVPCDMWDWGILLWRVHALSKKWSAFRRGAKYQEMFRCQLVGIPIDFHLATKNLVVFIFTARVENSRVFGISRASLQQKMARPLRPGRIQACWSWMDELLP